MEALLRSAGARNRDTVRQGWRLGVVAGGLVVGAAGFGFPGSAFAAPGNGDTGPGPPPGNGDSGPGTPAPTGDDPGDDGRDGEVAEDPLEECLADAYVMRKIREHIVKKSWETSQSYDQLYFTLLDVSVLAARGERVEPSAWQFSACKVYILHWRDQFPGLLQQHCGRAGPSCPKCYKQHHPGESEQQRLERAAAFVNSNCWAKHPRRFLHFDTFQFVFSKNYRCRKCGGNFLAHDAHLLPLLPESLRLMVPCLFTHKAGVSNSVKVQMDRNVVEGTSFNDYVFGVREVHAHRGMCIAIQYASLQQVQAPAQTKQRKLMEFFASSSAPLQAQAPPPPMPLAAPAAPASGAITAATTQPGELQQRQQPVPSPVGTVDWLLQQMSQLPPRNGGGT